MLEKDEITKVLDTLLKRKIENIGELKLVLSAIGSICLKSIEDTDLSLEEKLLLVDNMFFYELEIADTKFFTEKMWSFVDIKKERLNARNLVHNNIKRRV
jgi:hypothetical protein